ncbi:ribonuclease Y [bacterium]|nr:ribonuclease Y [bacterium]MBU4134351.1 ribonuclease Y [bacterium]
MNIILGVIAGFVMGALPVYVLYRSAMKKKSAGIIKKAEGDAAVIRENAVRENEKKLKEKEEEFMSRLRGKQSTMDKKENELSLKTAEIDGKIRDFEQKQREVENGRRDCERKEKLLRMKEEELSGKLSLQKELLQKAAHMSPEEAKKILISSMEDEARKDAHKLIGDIIKQAEIDAAEKVRGIIATAIQKASTDEVQALTTTVVQIKNDDLKGRIIGKEGRNIKAFEAATGVELIVDDSPGVITLSSFDGVRRYAGALTLEKLIADGRIHPGRIEELAKKSQEEAQAHIKETGRKTVQVLGIKDIKDNLIEMLGRMEFRFSYGQNILRHSMEVAKIAKAMAFEIGADPILAARAGLLHDIGKALPGEVDGSHAILGAEFLENNGESAKVVNAVKAHHEESPFETVEAVLVAAADALSATRPGARMESVEHYFQRIQKIEEIAMLFEGVERAYAISAGREVRVIVQPEKITEANAPVVAREIAQKIAREVEYPGQLKVSLIREQRWSELA